MESYTALYIREITLMSPRDEKEIIGRYAADAALATNHIERWAYQIGCMLRIEDYRRRILSMGFVTPQDTFILNAKYYNRLIDVMDELIDIRKSILEEPKVKSLFPG